MQLEAPRKGAGNKLGKPMWSRQYGSQPDYSLYSTAYCANKCVEVDNNILRPLQDEIEL